MPKDTNITFKLSEAEKEKIRALAAERDIPMSQIIREAINEYMDDFEKAKQFDPSTLKRFEDF